MANPKIAESAVARPKLTLRPYVSLTMPHTGAPIHMPANTTLLSPDSSAAVRFHSHLACRQRQWRCARKTRAGQVPCQLPPYDQQQLVSKSWSLLLAETACCQVRSGTSLEAGELIQESQLLVQLLPSLQHLPRGLDTTGSSPPWPVNTHQGITTQADTGLVQGRRG